MACTLFRLTVPEALAAVTVHAAGALALQETHGAIAVGMPANFVLWDVQEAAELAYWFGHSPVRQVVRQGVIAVDRTRMDSGERHLHTESSLVKTGSDSVITAGAGTGMSAIGALHVAELKRPSLVPDPGRHSAESPERRGGVDATDRIWGRPGSPMVDRRKR
jgi:hypothetical protein